MWFLVSICTGVKPVHFILFLTPCFITRFCLYVFVCAGTKSVKMECYFYILPNKSDGRMWKRVCVESKRSSLLLLIY